MNVEWQASGCMLQVDAEPRSLAACYETLAA